MWHNLCPTDCSVTSNIMSRFVNFVDRVASCFARGYDRLVPYSYWSVDDKRFATHWDELVGRTGALVQILPLLNAKQLVGALRGASGQ